MKVGARNTFSEAWKLYQLLFGRSVFAAAAVFAPLGLVEALAYELEGELLVATVLLALALGFFGELLVQGALVEVVRDIHEGRAPSPIGALYERTRPRLGALLLGTILYTAAFSFGLLLLIVPGLIVLARWSLIVPVIVLDGQSAGEARRRSSSLVRGQTGRVLWIIVLTLVLTTIVASMIGASLFWLPALLGTWLSGVIAASLTTPFEAHVLTVLYYRLTEPERPVVPERPRRWKTIWDEERETRVG
jgi:hypothetical protein